MLKRFNRLYARDQFAITSPFYFYPLEPEDYLVFARGYQGIQQYPLMAFIYLTHRCWDNCNGCFVAHINSPAAQLTWPVVERLIPDLVQGGVKAAKFAGRESTVSPILGQTLKLCHDHEMKTVLITAGANLATHAESIAEYCTHLRFSLNTTDPSLHEMLHNPSPRALPYNDRLACIRDIISARTGSHFTHGATFLVRPETINDAVPFAELCCKLGFQYVRYSMLDEVEGGWQEGWPSVRQALEKLDSNECQIWMNDLAVVPANTEWRQLPKGLLDPAIASRVTIHADGNVNACQEGWRGAWSEPNLATYGNLHELSFAKIWTGERRRHFLQELHAALLAGQDMLPGCERCKYKSLNTLLRWMYERFLVYDEPITSVYSDKKEGGRHVLDYNCRHPRVGQVNAS